MTKTFKEYIATGRRKTAVASVRLRPGNGKIDVNKKSFEKYFPLRVQRELILEPLKISGWEGKCDLVIRVNGGGIEGQACATRLGISRAVVKENEEAKQEFKPLGFLTRDPRKKERKKYGHKKARKSFQYSKR